MNNKLNDFVYIPEEEKQIFFSQFVFQRIYSIKIFDLLQGDIKPMNRKYSYLVLDTLYCEDYKELNISKGQAARTNFPYKSFLFAMDKVLKKDNKSRMQFIQNTRYDLFIDFIRHDEYHWEILKYSFVYNSI